MKESGLRKLSVCVIIASCSFSSGLSVKNANYARQPDQQPASRHLFLSCASRSAGSSCGDQNSIINIQPPRGITDATSAKPSVVEPTALLVSKDIALLAISFRASRRYAETWILRERRRPSRCWWRRCPSRELRLRTVRPAAQPAAAAGPAAHGPARSPCTAAASRVTLTVPDRSVLPTLLPSLTSVQMLVTACNLVYP